MFMSFRAWKSQQYLLNRMGIKELNTAYFTYPGVQIYLMLMAVAFGAAVYFGGSPLPLALAFGSAVIGHPIIWYITHRYILHSHILMKFKFTAKLWKRTHYDHHQRPNELGVLFGGLHTTLPPIALIYGPIGYWIAGPGGAALAIASGIFMTMFYEYVHCIQHLGFMPKPDTRIGRFLGHVKRAHLLHHFHDENGNYSITAFWLDDLLGTYYPDAAARVKSPTARNIGYTTEVAQQYPWVRLATEEAERKAGDGNSSGPGAPRSRVA
ncbi:MAG: sterol desaturase family protein [Pseudomonadota bacterium]